jgi:hypothetical protein
MSRIFVSALLLVAATIATAQDISPRCKMQNQEDAKELRAFCEDTTVPGTRDRAQCNAAALRVLVQRIAECEQRRK